MKTPLHARRHRGASLLLALVLLSLLSLLVTTAFSDNQWQLRIATHEIAEARALRAARSALTWAEEWLLSRPGDARPLPCPGPCAPGAAVLGPGAMPHDPGRLDEIWWLEHGHADGFDPVDGALVADRGSRRTPLGRWIVQEARFEAARGEHPARTWYRVVARAARAPRGAPVVLETIVARPWGEPGWTDALPAGDASFCRDPALHGPCGRLAWQRHR